MDRTSSLIQYAIEQLDEHSGYGAMKKELSLGLKILKMFLECVERWSSVDENVHQHLRDLLVDIGDAFADASFDLEDAEDGGEEKKTEVYSELNGKIEQFKPKVREAYGYLSSYCFQAHSHINDIDFWNGVISTLYNHLGYIASEAVLVAPLKKQVKAFNEDLRTFNLLFLYLSSYLSTIKGHTEFWVYLGGVATYAAQVSYLCWIGGMDSNKTEDLIILLSDLKERIKPCNTKTIDMYIGFLKALGSFNSYYVKSTVSEFVKRWVSLKDQSESLRAGLVFLIQFLVNTPEEFSDDVKFVSIDIKTVTAEAVSLSSVKRRSESDLKLFHMLGKIEILKAEVVIKGLMNRSVGDKASSVEPSKTLSEGVKMLQTFLNRPPRGMIEKGKLILMHIEAVVAGAASFCNKFNSIPISGDMIGDALKLLVNIKLLKAEIFWVELINRDTSLKQDIHILLVGLEDLRKIASGESNGNSDNVKPIFGLFDEVVSEAMLIYHSIQKNEDAENFAKEMNNLLPRLLDKIHLVKADAEDVHILVRSSSQFNFPKTNRLGFFDFFSENLRKLMNYNTNSLNSAKLLMKVVLLDLESLRSFLWDTAEQSKAHPELEVLHARIVDMAYEADYAIDSILVRTGDVWYHTLCLSDIVQELKLIKAQAAKMTENNSYGTEDEPINHAFKQVQSEDSGSLIKEVVVGLTDQEEIVLRGLKTGSEQRDIVSIVGMGGIGKTTLAKKIFNDRSVKECFSIRVWCSVSEPYHRGDVLLKIFSDVVKQTDLVGKESDEDKTPLPQPNDQLDKDWEDDIAQKLYRRLMKKKYLIVLDNLLDIQVWNDIKMSLPDESEGSRVLITSRNSKVASDAGGTSKPLPLRELSTDESWKLLETLVFHGEGCSKEFKEQGKKIVNGCEGLPIAVVAIAGVLEQKKEIDQWKKIADDINSGLDEDKEQRCMSVLGLSYEHLPDYLKPCFLYLGAFSGNTEIPVQKLLCLWVAEGFVNPLAENLAENYLRELICRNLIIGTKERSQGGLKACRVHDMLRTLCLRKAKQENFLKAVKGYEKLFPHDEDILFQTGYSGPLQTYEQHRLSIRSKRDHFSRLKPSGPQVRSLLFFATSDAYPRRPYDLSFISHNFRLLRVLDLESINVGTFFPSWIELLKQLRYLAVSGDIDSVPSSLAELWSLEALSVKGFKRLVAVPIAIWSLHSLRHLTVNDAADFHSEKDKSESSSQLANLVTLSSPCLSCGEVAEKMMKRMLCLKKLCCIFRKSHDHSSECKRAPVLSHLTKLESLKISYSGGIPSSCEFHFVSSLKKLTISNCHLPMDYVSMIGALPELKVLKLHSVTFDDQIWDTSVEVFESLEYLKLDNLTITQWNADSETFPSLRRLVLQNCHQLEELPDGLTQSTTLEAVELQRCSQVVETSAKEIQKSLLKYGMKKFKLIINLLEWICRSS